MWSAHYHPFIPLSGQNARSRIRILLISRRSPSKILPDLIFQIPGKLSHAYVQCRSWSLSLRAWEAGYWNMRAFGPLLNLSLEIQFSKTDLAAWWESFYLWPKACKFGVTLGDLLLWSRRNLSKKEDEAEALLPTLPRASSTWLVASWGLKCLVRQSKPLRSTSCCHPW